MQLGNGGGGTLVLSGVNTYSGGTVISASVVQVTNNSSVGTGTVTLDGGSSSPAPLHSASAMLTTAGAELRVTPNLSLIANFDGEFANGYQRYGRTGALRFTW